MSFHFVLKRSGWGYDDLYEAIKNGEKTSEWRDASPFWISRLFKKGAQSSVRHRIIHATGPLLFIHPDDHKHKTARFVVGYTKTPMLIADVKAIYYHPKANQFEIQIENVVEAKENEPV